MSPPAIRHHDARACLEAIGPSTAAVVAEAMGWSVDGARSVLDRLCRRGLARRTRGGMGLPSPVYYLADDEDDAPPPTRDRSELAHRTQRYVREWRRWRAGRAPNPLISLGRLPGQDEEDDDL